MLRKRQERLERNGRVSRFTLRGQDVADHKLERYEKSTRRPDIVASPMLARTPAGILCFTPNMDVDGRIGQAS